MGHLTMTVVLSPGYQVNCTFLKSFPHGLDLTQLIRATGKTQKSAEYQVLRMSIESHWSAMSV